MTESNPARCSSKPSQRQAGRVRALEHAGGNLTRIPSVGWRAKARASAVSRRTAMGFGPDPAIAPTLGLFRLSGWGV